MQHRRSKNRKKKNKTDLKKRVSVVNLMLWRFARDAKKCVPFLVNI